MEEDSRVWSRREQRMDTEWAHRYICTSERGWTAPAPPFTSSLLPPSAPSYDASGRGGGLLTLLPERGQVT